MKLLGLIIHGLFAILMIIVSSKTQHYHMDEIWN